MAGASTSNPTRPRRDKAVSDDTADISALKESLVDFKVHFLAEMAELRNLVTTLAAENAGLREQLRAQHDEFQLQLAKAEGKAKFAMDEALDNEERAERACNVMLRGLDVAADSTQQLLKEKVVENLTQANTGITLAVHEVEEVVQLGPAFFKVRFKDVRTRRKVFRKRHAVRTATDNKLRVQEDLTRLQQANVRRLQPVFELLRNKARAEGRWGPFFRGGMLYHHVGPVVPDQPQQAQLHEANWDPTALAAAIHEREHAAPAATAGQHANPSASQA